MIWILNSGRIKLIAYLLIGISRSAIYLRQKLISFFSLSSPKWAEIDYLANSLPFFIASRPFSANVYSHLSISSWPTYSVILTRSDPETIPRWIPLAWTAVNVSIISYWIDYLAGVNVWSTSKRMSCFLAPSIFEMLKSFLF